MMHGLATIHVSGDRLLTLILLMAIALTSAISGCKKSDKPITLNLCQDGTVVPLILFAQEKGYFADAGIEINFFPMGDGKIAMEGLLGGKCDAAVVAETAILSRSPDVKEFAVIATAGATDNASGIVTDRRSGIATVSDLKGKRIGVRKGEISHFFLETLLIKNGIRPEQTRTKFIEPRYLSEALLKGEIDAFASSDIYLEEAMRRLAGNAALISEPGLCLNHSFILINRQFLKEHPATAEEILLALTKAEAKVSESMEELVSVVAKRRELSTDTARKLVSRYRPRVGLQQQIFPGLAEYANFLQEQGVPVRRMEELYTSIIDDTAMKKIKPSAVNIK